MFYLHQKIKAKRILPGNISPMVSVVIPFRNEERHLQELLHALEDQHYPVEDWEVIFVNDHSTDKGPGLIEEWSKEVPLKVKLLRLNDLKGKKNALRAGIENASSEIIVQTDADCRMDPNWLQRSVESLVLNEATASLGVVRMEAEKNYWLSQVFCLEFMALQAVGAALAGMGLPVMANGANLVYRRQSWLDFHPENEWAGGDDVFYIQQLAMAGKHNVAFNFKSQVSTTAPETLNDFIDQRIRWGGKTPSYRMPSAKYLAYLICVVNGVLFIHLLAAPFSLFGILSFLVLMMIKSIPEFLLMHQFASRTNQQHLMKWFIPAAFLYPIYIVATSILILIKTEKVKWKGRPLRTR